MQKCYIESFVGETLNAAVLDSGCAQTVCGEGWLQCYLETLSSDELKSVSNEESYTNIRFGDGKTVSALKRVNIPAYIGNKCIRIEIHVVPCELPLLFSKASMKAAKAK